MSFTAPILNGKNLPEPVILGHFLPWFTQENAKRPTFAKARVVELDASDCPGIAGSANFSGWLVRANVLPGSPVHVTDCPGAMRTVLGV